MRIIHAIPAALSLASAALASPLFTHVLHEKRHRANDLEWTKVARLTPELRIPVGIALTQTNLDKGHDWLMEVSDPRSVNYGKHWTPEELIDAFKPSDDTINAVTKWLIDAGISIDRIQTSRSLNWLHINTTVEEAESLFNAEYHYFRHETGAPHVACDEYSLPAHLKKHIDFVTPSVHMDAKVERGPKQEKMPKEVAEAIAKRELGIEDASFLNIGIPGNNVASPKLGATAVLYPNATGGNSFGNLLSTCNVTITPDCLRALYGFNYNSASLINSKNSYGIVEYTPQNYVPTDLDVFFRRYGPAAAVGSRPIFDSIDGGVLVTSNSGFNGNGESNLDLQYAMSLVYPQNVTLYQVGDPIIGASFNTFLDALDTTYCATEVKTYPDPSNATGSYKGPQDCGRYTPAAVISTSYGYNEISLTPAYEQRQCNEYLKLGLIGTTFVFSSGDYGVGGNSGRCINSNYTAYTNGSYGVFNPAFPSVCPYVTAIGATQVIPSANVITSIVTGTQPEMACETVIYSGGGFSNNFAMPSYQSAAVKSWFKNYPPPYNASQFNNSQVTRGFPDISANGAWYVIAVQGVFSYVFGTSASAPVIGAMVTLINQARLNAGKSTVGFMNPTLYANPSAMKDVTIGGNRGCGTAGFSSSPGWDPVTGLGTPRFAQLQSVFMALP